MKNRRHVAFSVGSILLILLLVSVSFGWKKRVDAIRDQKFSTIADRVHFSIQQARDLSVVSPGRARALVLGAQTNLDEELNTEKDRALRARLATLSQEVTDALRGAGRVMSVIPEIYLDLGFIREGTKGSAMSLAGKNLVVFDKTAHVVLFISSVDRGGEVIGGGDTIVTARAVAGTEKQTYVLTDHSVVRIDGDKKTSDPVITDDEEIWKDPSDIAVFAGNVYIVDRGTSEVYKYPSAGSGFGNRKRWFAPGIVPDLSAIQSFSVEGDAWFLFSNGTLKRYHQGAPVSFSESGADEFSEAESLSVPPDGTRVWILDRGNGKIVAFDRESGEYTGQWVSDTIKSATSIAVSEELGKAFLLAGEKIYVVAIQ